MESQLRGIADKDLDDEEMARNASINIIMKGFMNHPVLFHQLNLILRFPEMKMREKIG